MQAIRTLYKGILFRSKLEAQWAKFFDYLKIPWIYEPAGYIFADGTQYLPDFWLPDSKQWFEVKGIMSEKDTHKIELLCYESKHDVVVGYANGEFDMYDTFFADEDGKKELTHYSKGETYINRCRVCKKYSFMNSVGSYQCQCCNAYDGDSYINWIMEGEINHWSRKEHNEWVQISRIDVRENN